MGGANLNHYLKTWPLYFSATWDGKKTFEVRKFDRAFHTQNHLYLLEWDPHNEKYTGRWIKCRITYLCVLPDPMGTYVGMQLSIDSKGLDTDILGLIEIMGDDIGSP
jgi:hypothetical protein